MCSGNEASAHRLYSQEPFPLALTPTIFPHSRHMKHHMQDMGYMEDVKLDDNEAMEFHYFKLHDTDNNNKLDGLELAAAITHYHEPGEEGKHQVL